MTVSIPAAGPGRGLPLPADPPQASWHGPRACMSRAGIRFGTLGSERLLFEDHPSLSPGQDVGQQRLGCHWGFGPWCRKGTRA